MASTDDSRAVPAERATADPNAPTTDAAPNVQTRGTPPTAAADDVAAPAAADDVAGDGSGIPDGTVIHDGPNETVVKEAGPNFRFHDNTGNAAAPSLSNDPRQNVEPSRPSTT